ncbi:MAG: methionine--tRNA ligase [Acidobacteria bacterium]|nr:MAG: methionine--tRNA ligase [Acidobacteriota bacterium]
MPFTLTTPLYYVNARPHLGHAYSTLAADAMVRFQRQQRQEAFLLTGTDEHGQKIERAAAAQNIAPQAFADAISAEFRSEWDRLGLHYDAFIRTTEPRHTRAVQDVFERLRRNGAIYKGSYSGPYCVSDELFVGEGKVGDPCPLCGKPTELVSEENYYFKLSAYGDQLLKLYQDNPDFIRPETRRNEVIAFVKSGLKDVSITRTSITWGIPVPGDEKHVLYVWFDALIGYLSGMGYASPNEADRARWEHLWPAWHLVGKEIVRFHCVYWPAFLLAAGLPLPRGIIAHGWLLFDEAKMSKSVGNVVRPEPIRQVLGADALRYFLLREVSFGQDGNFSYAALIDRYNADLANGWGNLAARLLAMIDKYCGGRVPPLHRTSGAIPPVNQTRTHFVDNMENWQFSRALEAVWALIGQTDRYISAAKPWDLAKGGAATAAQLDDVLRDGYEVLRWTAVLLAAILPESAERLWQQLGLPGKPQGVPYATLQWNMPLPAGPQLGARAPLFPRADKVKTMEELKILEESHQPSAISHQSPGAGDGRISIDDFGKVEMRVGTIVAAERIEKADKLLKLTVDIGAEVRTICAGIAKSYDPATLPGRKVVIVANLAPRKLRGIESNGMIVAATLPDGSAALISVPDDTPNGARLK